MKGVIMVAGKGAERLFTGRDRGFWRVWAFQPSFALDVPVLGVGLLLLALSHAMRQGLALQRDAQLTI